MSADSPVTESPLQTPRATAWQVVTGPPSSGKTSLIAALEAMGHRVVAETARAHIARLDRTAAEIAADRGLQAEMQQSIARLQHAVELGLDTERTLFLDRALPDSLAYFRALGLPERDLLERSRTFRYARVFVLEPLQLRRDGLRFEDQEQAQALSRRLVAAYRELDYELVSVPAFTGRTVAEAVEARLAFILARTVP